MASMERASLEKVSMSRAWLAARGWSIYLIALIFRIANRNPQQRFRIQKLEEAGRKGIGGIVDVGWPDGALRTDEAQIGAGPLRLSAVQGKGERLNVGVFQSCGCGGMRRFGRVRGHAQVVMVSGAQSFGHFVERFRFHRGAFHRQRKPGAREA